MKYIWTMTNSELALGAHGKAVLYPATSKFILGDRAYMNLMTATCRRRNTRNSELVGRVVFLGQNLNFRDLLINIDMITRRLYGVGAPLEEMGTLFIKDRIL